jgi:hypothetical protein
MAIRIADNLVALEVDGAVVAIARFGQRASAVGKRGVDRLHSSRPPVQPQLAITAMTLAERLAEGSPAAGHRGLGSDCRCLPWLLDLVPEFRRYDVVRPGYVNLISE